MKNQYFGDINDYRKYGLLRVLGRSSGLSIGVCWLLTAVGDGGDGELRDYLMKPAHWRRYDPELYDKLRQLGDRQTPRTVRDAQEWALIPNATYWDAVVPDDLAGREAYFTSGMSTLRSCELIFLDPDNGIEVNSIKRGTRGSSRYVYWTELKAVHNRGQSILVYQHFPRVPHGPFLQFIADRLAEELPASRVCAFSTAYVAFFLVQQSKHVRVFENAIEEIRGQWSTQIDVASLVTDLPRSVSHGR